MAFDLEKLTKEQAEKIMACKSADELLNLAGEMGLTLSEEDAKNCLRQLAGDSLSPDDLDQVSGGIDLLGMIKKVDKLVRKK